MLELFVITCQAQKGHDQKIVHLRVFIFKNLASLIIWCFSVSISKPKQVQHAYRFGC